MLLHQQSGRRYVGRSSTLRERWAQHSRKPPTRIRTFLNNNRERFHDAFRMIPLKSTVSDQHARHLEKHYILALCAREKDGFNILEGDPAYSDIYRTLKSRGAI
jgi:hypothetical protein